MPSDVGPPLMTVNFMQLLGAHGVLPRSYTELVLSQAAAKQTVLRDFLDLFQHRLVSLFYQAWRKYRVLESESNEATSLSTIVQHLIGLGTEGLRNRQPVLDESLGFYAGLIVQQPHSPTALQLLLSDYFDVPVQIEQFIGAWYDLDTASQCNLGGSGEDRRQLGLGAVVGDQVWEVRAKVRIVLGPLSRRQYLDFLPSGSAYAPLKALARFFSDEVDFEAQLVLASEEAPPCALGAVGETAPKLGWVSWVKTRPMDRDPADTIIPL
jgi:type VI secretion system protein ImpH